MTALRHVKPALLRSRPTRVRAPGGVRSTKREPRRPAPGRKRRVMKKLRAAVGTVPDFDPRELLEALAFSRAGAGRHPCRQRLERAHRSAADGTVVRLRRCDPDRRFRCTRCSRVLAARGARSRWQPTSSTTPDALIQAQREHHASVVMSAHPTTRPGACCPRTRSSACAATATRSSSSTRVPLVRVTIGVPSATTTEPHRPGTSPRRGNGGLRAVTAGFTQLERSTRPTALQPELFSSAALAVLSARPRRAAWRGWCGADGLSPTRADSRRAPIDPTELTCSRSRAAPRRTSREIYEAGVLVRDGARRCCRLPAGVGGEGRENAASAALPYPWANGKGADVTAGTIDRKTARRNHSRFPRRQRSSSIEPHRLLDHI